MSKEPPVISHEGRGNGGSLGVGNGGGMPPTGGGPFPGSGGNGNSGNASALGSGEGGDNNMGRELMILQTQMVQLLQQMAKLQNLTIEKTVRPMAKIPEPAPYKGDPGNLERFL